MEEIIEKLNLIKSQIVIPQKTSAVDKLVERANLIGYKSGINTAIQILNAVEREAVATQVNPEEDFYCTEYSDFGELKCKSQCPYCERVS